MKLVYRFESPRDSTLRSPARSRFFVLTAIVAVHKLVAIALCLADLVALLAVVEAGIVLVVVPWGRWGRFR